MDKMRVKWQPGIMVRDHQPLKLEYIEDTRSKWDKPLEHPFRYTLKHRWPVVVAGSALGGIIGALIGTQ